MSAYNSQHEAPPEEEYSSRCPAADCPMMASLYIDGGPWACRYHAKQPVNIWVKITELLKQNKRWFKILKAADNLSAAEYDELQRADSWELDELLRPVKDELHPCWTLRIKETIYRALKDKINAIAEANEVGGGGGYKNASSIRDLTSGVLLKKVKPNKYRGEK